MKCRYLEYILKTERLAEVHDYRMRQYRIAALSVPRSIESSLESDRLLVAGFVTVILPSINYAEGHTRVFPR